MKSLNLILLSLCVAIGCAPKQADTGGSTGTTSASQASTTGSTEPTTATTTTTDTTAPDKPEQKADPATIPASLKHAAFDYYGLGNGKAMDLVLKTPDQPARTGGVVAELEKVEGAKAFFKVVRSGALAKDLGDDSVMVDSTGVYMTGTSIGTISPEKFLALPADLAPGKTWPLKTKVVRQDGQEIQEDSVYKVEGVRDLTTKSGVQKALLVTSNGTAIVSQGGTKTTAKYQTKSWYVKGVGPVKIEISLTSPGKPTQTLTVEQSN